MPILACMYGGAIIVIRSNTIILLLYMVGAYNYEH